MKPLLDLLDLPDVLTVELTRHPGDPRRYRFGVTIWTGDRARAVQFAGRGPNLRSACEDAAKLYQAIYVPLPIETEAQ